MVVCTLSFGRAVDDVVGSRLQDSSVARLHVASVHSCSYDPKVNNIYYTSSYYYIIMHTTRTPLISIMKAIISGHLFIFCLCTVCILARVVGIFLKYELVQYIHRLTPYI